MTPNPQTRNHGKWPQISYKLNSLECWTRISFQELEYLGQQCIGNNYNKKGFFFSLSSWIFYAFQFYAVRLSGFATIFPRSGVYSLGCSHLRIASWCVVVTEGSSQLCCVVDMCLIFCHDSFVTRSHEVSVPLTTYCIYISFIYLIFRVPCFRIWGDFPWFRVLGFGVIFRGSGIPRFRLLGSPVISCVICIWKEKKKPYKDFERTCN